jgi:hypothetical protein
MRLCEFAENDILLEYVLTEEEQQARFKFLSAAAAKLKGAAEQKVTMVKNAADAMRLLYQVVKNPTVLIQAITLLRQALKQLLAKAHASVVEFLENQLEEIEACRYDVVSDKDTALQNIIDEIVGLYLSTLYKLKFLS